MEGGVDAYETALTHTGGQFIIGRSYTIATAGDTNFVAIGAANNNVGTVFTATGVGAGTGTANSQGAVARPDNPSGIFMDARPARTVVASGIGNTSLSGDGIAINRVRGRYSDNIATTVNGVAGGVTNTSFGHGGDITINSAGDLTMVAANGLDSGAMVGHGGRSTHGDHFGNISVNAVGNILFTREAWQVDAMGQDISNRGLNSPVQIGHGGVFYQGGSTGNIDVDAGGSIEFYAGRQDSFAMIGHGGRGETSTSTNTTRGADQANGTHSGDITVDAGLGIKFRSGFGSAARSFS